MHFGPDEILLNASLDFEDGLRAEAVEASISEFEGLIKQRFPAIRRVFIEAQCWRGHALDLSADNAVRCHDRPLQIQQRTES